MSDLGDEVDDGEKDVAGDVSDETGEMDEDFYEEVDGSYQTYVDGKEGDSKSDANVEDFEQKNLDENNKAELKTEVDGKYNEYINGKSFTSDAKSDAKEDIDSLKCRNQSLENQAHPETGVPFERREVEVDGKTYDVVVPNFESTYDAQLPEDLYKETDYKQFKECDQQLKNDVENNPELKAKFDEEQLDQISNGDTPSGYTWHHDSETGKMQLVDTEMHQRTAHTGGKAIWGGGAENR